MGISGGEIILILLLFLLLFGADKIPEIARTIGLGMREFRKATDQVRDEIHLASIEKIDDVEVIDEMDHDNSSLDNSGHNDKATHRLSDHNQGEGI